MLVGRRAEGIKDDSWVFWPEQLGRCWVVPSAFKMMKGLFGKVPCGEEFAVVHSEPVGGAEV